MASKYPGVPRFSVHLATILVKRGKAGRAAEMLERALEYAPDSRRLLTDLAAVYCRLGEWENGKNCFLRCLEKIDDDNQKAPVYGNFFKRCIEFNDFNEIETASCPGYIKEYFTKYEYRIEKMAEEIFGGFPHYSREYFKQIRILPAMQLLKRSVRPCDMQSEFVVISDGARRTTGVPEAYDNTVYLVGGSRTYGAYCEDSHTIASFLQSLYASSPGKRMRVVNLGVPAQKQSNAFLIIMGENIQKNDVVVHLPIIMTNPMDADERAKALQYESAMREFCFRKGAHFHVALLPNVFGVANPSPREKSIQEMEMRGGGWGAGGNKKIEIYLDNYNAYRDMLQQNEFQAIPLQHVAERPHGLGEIFWDWMHFNHRANKRIARELHAGLMQPAVAAKTRVSDELLARMQCDAKQYLKWATCEYSTAQSNIDEWLRGVKNAQFSGLGRIGAIVMNCNPFTLGHRHLVGCAAKMVDGLYLFVVQEDKSFFPFQDRLSLVRQGVKHISTPIHVVPSGEFIISNLVFPGYFAETRAITPADSTADVAIFGSIIAPALGITHRFVGEEPNCATTNEYNETMKFLLPGLGVEMHVIPRKNNQGTPISATTVRNCLQNNDFETIAKLVPATTLDYLQRFAQ